MTTPLIFHSSLGRLPDVQRLLLEGHDPNTRDDTGDIALVSAASRGHLAIVELLLRSGANPNQKVISNSALSCAIRQRNADMLELLLAHPKLKSELVEDAFVEAASRGYSDFVKRLMKTGVDPNAKFLYGDVLVRATSGGHVETVELLLANGADPNAIDREGRSILMRLIDKAFFYGDRCAGAVGVLIAHGADPNIVNKEGLSFLTQSARLGRDSMVCVLAASGLPLNAPDKNGNTALEVAIDAGEIKVVRFLLNSGVDVNSKGQDGQPSIVRAITGDCYQKKKVVDLLLANGADPKAVDRSGYTAYERAVQVGQRSLARTLQELEPNLFQQSVPLSRSQPQDKLKPRKAQPDKENSNNSNTFINSLNKLIGLDRVKNDVTQLVNFLRIQQIRKQKGLSVPEQSLHMVFTGNPGTGKTTIARLIAQIYKSMGILSQGQFVETDRAGLVGGYLGQTAIKTQGVVESALGGVLFIDEAYSLTDNTHGHDMYGQEAVATLLKMMEDHRDDLIVIVAGYTEPMQKFVRSNPGLQSRFNKFLHFDDYAPAELTEIFGHFAALADYKLHPATELKLHNVFAGLYAARDETFGNARLARNLFEKAINAHANRMVSAGMTDEASLVTLYPEDVPNG